MTLANIIKLVEKEKASLKGYDISLYLSEVQPLCESFLKDNSFGLRKAEIIKIIFLNKDPLNASKILDLLSVIENDNVAYSILTMIGTNRNNKEFIKILKCFIGQNTQDFKNIAKISSEISKFSIRNNGEETKDLMLCVKYAVDLPDKARAILGLINYIDEDILKILMELAAFIPFIDFNKFISAYQNIVKKYKSHERSRQKALNKLDELIAKLSIEGEINLIEKIIELCPNETLKSAVLDYIISHNAAYYQNLSSEYTKIKANSPESLRNLLALYGYNYDELQSNEKEQVKVIGYTKLEEILITIKQYNLKIKINDILNIDLNKLNKVIVLINRGIITSEYVSNNILLIFPNNDLLTLLNNNVEALAKHNFNISDYPDILDILLSENVINNLNILEAYHIHTRDCNSILFLNRTDLELVIDFIIEIGLYDNLSTSLDLLNLSIAELNFYKTCSVLDIDYEVIKQFSLPELNLSFLIPEFYQEHLNNNTPNVVSLPEKFRDNLENAEVMILNDVYVSVPRFLRNLGKMPEINDDTIMYALLYQSHYSLEEVEKLKNAVYNKQAANELNRNLTSN